MGYRHGCAPRGERGQREIYPVPEKGRLFRLAALCVACGMVGSAVSAWAQEGYVSYDEEGEPNRATKMCKFPKGRPPPPPGKCFAPPYDADGNPTYHYVLGGDKPLYYERDGEGEPDYTSPVNGWMDFSTYRGWRTYHADCHVCHGPDGLGSTYAPGLLHSIGALTWDEFFSVVINGRNEEQGAQKGNVMPAFGNNPNVAGEIEPIYRYLRMRYEGKLRRGRSPPKLTKYVDPDEEE